MKLSGVKLCYFRPEYSHAITQTASSHRQRTDGHVENSNTQGGGDITSERPNDFELSVREKGLTYYRVFPKCLLKGGNLVFALLAPSLLFNLNNGPWALIRKVIFRVANVIVSSLKHYKLLTSVTRVVLLFQGTSLLDGSMSRNQVKSLFEYLVSAYCKYRKSRPSRHPPPWGSRLNADEIKLSITVDFLCDD